MKTIKSFPETIFVLATCLLVGCGKSVYNYEMYSNEELLLEESLVHENSNEERSFSENFSYSNDGGDNEKKKNQSTEEQTTISQNRSGIGTIKGIYCHEQLPHVTFTSMGNITMSGNTEEKTKKFHPSKNHLTPYVEEQKITKMHEIIETSKNFQRESELAKAKLQFLNNKAYNNKNLRIDLLKLLQKYDLQNHFNNSKEKMTSDKLDLENTNLKNENKEFRNDKKIYKERINILEQSNARLEKKNARYKNFCSDYNSYSSDFSDNFNAEIMPLNRFNQYLETVESVEENEKVESEKIKKMKDYVMQCLEHSERLQQQMDALQNLGDVKNNEIETLKKKIETLEESMLVILNHFEQETISKKTHESITKKSNYESQLNSKSNIEKEEYIPRSSTISSNRIISLSPKNSNRKNSLINSRILTENSLEKYITPTNNNSKMVYTEYNQSPTTFVKKWEMGNSPNSTTSPSQGYPYGIESRGTIYPSYSSTPKRVYTHINTGIEPSTINRMLKVPESSTTIPGKQEVYQSFKLSNKNIGDKRKKGLRNTTIVQQKKSMQTEDPEKNETKFNYSFVICSQVK